MRSDHIFLHHRGALSARHMVIQQYARRNKDVADMLVNMSAGSVERE